MPFAPSHQRSWDGRRLSVESAEAFRNLEARIVELESAPATVTSVKAIDLTNVPGVRGAWDFEDDMADRSGAARTLSTISGNGPRYSTVGGKRCAWMNGGAAWGRTVNDADLKIAGDITVHALLRFMETGGVGGAGQTICAYQLNGNELAAGNMQYRLFLGPSGSSYLKFESESGAGVNSTLDFAIGAVVGEWALYTVTRKANVVALYVNGAAAGDTGTLTAPTGGGDGNFEIRDLLGFVGDIVVCNEAHTAKKILEIAQQAVG